MLIALTANETVRVEHLDVIRKQNDTKNVKLCINFIWYDSEIRTIPLGATRSVAKTEFPHFEQSLPAESAPYMNTQKIHSIILNTSSLAKNTYIVRKIEI
jgi:hypothetical protein